MEAGLAQAGGPVRGIARLQHRPQAAPEVAGERSPGMHRGVLHDDVVVIELEYRGERRQPGERERGGEELHFGAVNARSRIATASHQRSDACSMTSITLVPSRSTSATTQ